MCLGGSSRSSSTSTASNSTTVNVSTPINVNTADLADAIKALAGEQGQAAQLQFAGGIYQAKTAAAARIAAAQIGAGPSLTSIILVVVAIAGLLVTAGLIKV